MINRLARALREYPKYAYYYGRDKLNRDWSIERPQFAPIASTTPSPADLADAIEFHLVADDMARYEFSQPDAARTERVTRIPNKLHTTRCFICDGPLQPFLQTVNAEAPDDLIEVSWCPACDHCQYSVMPDKQWITNWYLTTWDTTTALTENLARRKPTYRYYKRLLPYLGNRKLKILDIGAGYGEKMLPFKEAGHALYCTEATPGRAEYLRQHLTKQVYQGTLDDPAVRQALIDNGPYDLIFSYHVIEHVYNPAQELQLLQQITEDGALFYLAIPEFYKEGILNNLYSLEHIASFSRNSGCRLLNRLGFEIVKAADDPLQYYSDYCQYFIGRRTSGCDLKPSIPQSPGHLHDYLRRALKLDKIAGMKESAFSYTYFNHRPLTYQVSAETKRLCADFPNHLPVRFVHHGLPLFWMYS